MLTARSCSVGRQRSLTFAALIRIVRVRKRYSNGLKSHGHGTRPDTARLSRLGAAWLSAGWLLSGEPGFRPQRLFSWRNTHLRLGYAAMWRGRSIEILDLGVKRRGNLEPRNARPLEVRVEKAVHAIRRNGKLAASVDTDHA